MTVLRRFGRFWLDFVVGDAWEVALTIGLALAALAVVAERGNEHPALGFVALGVVLGVNAVALRRAAGASSKKVDGQDHSTPPA